MSRSKHPSPAFLSLSVFFPNLLFWGQNSVTHVLLGQLKYDIEEHNCCNIGALLPLLLCLQK